MGRAIRAWCFLSLSVGCAGARWESLDFTHLPSADQYPGAKRLVLLDETEIRFLRDPKTGRAAADQREHFRGRRLTPEAPQWPAAASGYMRGFSEVRELRARVVSPSGEVQESPQASRVDRPITDSSLFDDGRVVSLSGAAVPEGGVYETEEVVRYLEPRLFGFALPLVGQDPIRVRRITLVVPPGWVVETAWRFSKPEKVSRETDPDGTVRLTLELKDVAASPDEPLGVFEPPSLLVRLKSWDDADGPGQAFKDPRELSRWMHALMAPAAQTSPELQAEAARISALAGADVEARARAAHRYVCERIQYCAIEVGYGAWRPHPAGEVNRLAYGDCKDKAMLLHVLLRELGIASDVVLITFHGGVPRPFGLPTVTGNFNHAILRVALPSGPVFTDPTAERVPFGQLPYGDLDADVLPATAEGAPLDHTPARAAVTDEVSLRLEGRLLETGGIDGRFEADLRGPGASEWRSTVAERPAADPGEPWCRLFDTPCTLKNLTLEGVKKGEDQLRLRSDISLERVTQVAAGAVVLRPAVLDHWDVPTPPVTPRLLDARLFAPRSRTSQWRFVLPKGWTVEPPGAPVHVKTAFAEYDLAWSVEPGVLTLRREQRTLRWRVAASEYEALRGFYSAMRAAEAKPVVIHQETSP